MPNMVVGLDKLMPSIHILVSLGMLVAVVSFVFYSAVLLVVPGLGRTHSTSAESIHRVRRFKLQEEHLTTNPLPEQ